MLILLVTLYNNKNLIWTHKLRLVSFYSQSTIDINVQKLLLVSTLDFHSDRYRRCRRHLCRRCCLYYQLNKLVKMATATDDSVINHRMCFILISAIFGKPNYIFIGSFIFVYFFQSCSILKIDFSKFNFPREIWFHLPLNEIVYKLLLLLPITLCGVIGNLLLLNIIIMNRALHSSTNYILVNMIAADTLTVMFCPAVFICTDFFQNYLLGFVGCKMDGFLQGLFCCCWFYFYFLLKFEIYFNHLFVELLSM